jgi:hypothetical protein
VTSTRTGVVAVSASDVWAVGDYDAWHFDGTAWTVSAAGAQFAIDVHAGAGAVLAVGSFIADPYGGGVRYPIGYRFSGTTWQQHHAAALAPGAFDGVAVRAADEGDRGRLLRPVRLCAALHRHRVATAGRGQ